MENKENTYSIISSFEKWEGFYKLFRLKFVFLYLKYFLELNYYKLLNKKTKVKDYELKLNQLKDLPYEITVNSKKYIIKGHKTLTESLIRGFSDLNIELKHNELADNIIVLWADKTDIKIIDKLKRNKKIKKVVTVPTACKYDYNGLMYGFAKYNCIDRVLYASQEVADYAKTIIKEKYWNKVLAWHSGVEFPPPNNILNNTHILNSCICFYKFLPVDNDLTDYIKSFGIKCINIEYGKYKFDDWINILNKVDFVIFIQDCCETQGLAMAEAWAHNKPTLIKYNHNTQNRTTAPYLTDKTGLYWHKKEDLKNLINEYHKNQKAFLDRFEPYIWTEKNLSDKASVQKLIDIFSSIA